MNHGGDTNPEWQFDRNCLDPSYRAEGISAFMRLRDEEEFVEQAILSHLPFFDEIIAVHNRCTDSTPEILAKLEKLYPDKLKVYHYAPYVYPQGSKEHIALPADSPHSLVNYYNYALSKTTRKIAVKLDGDHIAIPETLSPVVAELREKGTAHFMGFRGINLARDMFGNAAVLEQRPLIGGGDIGFFTVGKDTYFIHHENFELFNHKMPHRLCGTLFFHCKHLKRCKGFSNYDLDDNPDSRYHAQMEWVQQHQATTPFADFAQAQGLTHIALPESLLTR